MNDDMKAMTDMLAASYQNLLEGLALWLPRIMLGLVLLALGWLLARLTAFLVGKALRLARFDQAMEKLQVSGMLRQARIEKKPSYMLARFTYWAIWILIIIGFADALQLEIVSEKIGQLFNYLPNIIIALFILVGGMYVGQALRKAVRDSFTTYGVKSGKVIGDILFYVLALVVVLTALDQLQFNIDLLTSNVMILLGGIALAFAIAYGLSAKEIVPHMLSSYYSKNTFKVGQEVIVGESSGTIEEITRLSVVIRTDNGRRIIPAQTFITQEIEIQDSEG